MGVGYANGIRMSMDGTQMERRWRTDSGNGSQIERGSNLLQHFPKRKGSHEYQPQSVEPIPLKENTHLASTRKIQTLSQGEAPTWRCI